MDNLLEQIITSLSEADSVRTLKGTAIKRFRGLVGKEVGPQVYVHRDYAREVIPGDLLDKAEAALDAQQGDFLYNCLMWDRSTNMIRFDEAPEFDGAREPFVGDYVQVFPSGKTVRGHSDAIWHHKWLWVKDDYHGFDVEAQKRWSQKWLGKVPEVAKGSYNSFQDQLNRFKVEETWISKADRERMNRSGQVKGVVGPNAVVPRYVRSLNPKGLSILDFGAGEMAQHTMSLRNDGYDVTAYDRDNNVTDRHDPGALSRQYDLVFASNTVNVQPSVPAMRQTLRQIRDAVKPGGRAVFNYPASPRYCVPPKTAAEVKEIVTEIFGVEPRLVWGTPSVPVWEIKK